MQTFRFVVIVPLAVATETGRINVSEDISVSSSSHGMGDKWMDQDPQQSYKEIGRDCSLCSLRGTLSYYQVRFLDLLGLLGQQLVLTDTTITITRQKPDSLRKLSTQFVMLIATKRRTSTLLFRSEDRLLTGPTP
jgi:hypothetical protein